MSFGGKTIFAEVQNEAWCHFYSSELACQGDKASRVCFHCCTTGWHQGLRPTGNQLQSYNRKEYVLQCFCLPLAEKYNALFENTGVDFIALASLLIGGLYYLNLHKERSTFCAIDVTKEEGIERINKAIETFANIMFSFLEHRDTTQDIAERIRAKGIDEQTIKECLQI